MIYFSSDWHLGHGNNIVYSQRVWSVPDKFQELVVSLKDANKITLRKEWNPSKDTITVHDMTIIGNVNKTVGEDDTLYFLGDLLFAERDTYQDTLKMYRDLLKCKNIILLLGNHDKELKGCIPDLPSVMMVNYESQKIFLSHFAHAIWDCSHHGAWHLYGHNHGTVEEKLDQIMPERKSMDVGIDNAYKLFGQARPFSFLEIKAIMDKRKGFA